MTDDEITKEVNAAYDRYKSGEAVLISSEEVNEIMRKKKLATLKKIAELDDD